MSKNDIIQQLKTLRRIQPDVFWKENTARLLNAYGQRIAGEKRVSRQRIAFFAIFQYFRELLFRPAVVVATMLLLIFTSGLIVNAAFYSMPGSILYPFKIYLEKAHLAFVQDREAKTALKLDFAKKRLDELEKVMQQKDDPEMKAKKVHLVMNTFQKGVELVKEEIEKEPEQKEANFQIAITLNETTDELHKKVEGEAIPDEAKKTIEASLNTAEQTEISALINLLMQNSTDSSEPEEESRQKAKELLQKKIDNLKTKLDAASDFFQQFQDDDFETSQDIHIAQNLMEGIQKDVSQEAFEDLSEKIQAVKAIVNELSEKQKKAQEQLSSEDTETQPEEQGTGLEDGVSVSENQQTEDVETAASRERATSSENREE